MLCLLSYFYHAHPTVLLKYESIKFSWFYLIVLHYTDCHYITTVSLNFQKAFFFLTTRTFWSKNIKKSKKWAQLQHYCQISIKNWHDIGFYHYLPLKYFINTFFLSTLRENGPCRLKLITSSKIFLYIYEVFSIAPRSCLYRLIERKAPIS